MDKIEQAKALLIEIILEKSKGTSFGYGEEEGNEGWPRWSFYIGAQNQFFACENGKRSSGKANAKNLEKLSLLVLAAVAENGLGGEQLFNAMDKDLKYCMIEEAETDAAAFKNEQSMNKQSKKNSLK